MVDIRRNLVKSEVYSKSLIVSIIYKFSDVINIINAYS